jgi:hypothetical protein
VAGSAVKIHIAPAEVRFLSWFTELMMTRRAQLAYVAWIVLSLLAWFLSLVYLRGLYPYWEDDVGRKIGWFIKGTLVCAWSILSFGFCPGVINGYIPGSDWESGLRLFWVSSGFSL